MNLKNVMRFIELYTTLRILAAHYLWLLLLFLSKIVGIYVTGFIPLALHFLLNLHWMCVIASLEWSSKKRWFKLNRFPRNFFGFYEISAITEMKTSNFTAHCLFNLVNNMQKAETCILHNLLLLLLFNERFAVQLIYGCALKDSWLNADAWDGLKRNNTSIYRFESFHFAI